MQIHKAAAKATKNLTAVNILVIVLSHHLPEHIAEVVAGRGERRFCRCEVGFRHIKVAFGK